MAGMLENISTITVIARTTIVTVYRAAQVVASLPNSSYQNKAREGQFHYFLFSYMCSYCFISFSEHLIILLSFRHSQRLYFINYFQLWFTQTMKHELELTRYFLLFLCHLQFAQIHPQIVLSQGRQGIFQGHFPEPSLSFLLQLHFLTS